MLKGLVQRLLALIYAYLFVGYSLRPPGFAEPVAGRTDCQRVHLDVFHRFFAQASGVMCNGTPTVTRWWRRD